MPTVTPISGGRSLESFGHAPRMPTESPVDFTVEFSKDVARVINYDDPMGRLKFTFDGSEKGKKWVVLEHHPRDWPRGPRYDIAFQRTKQFLESCGFGVEIYGE